MDEEAISNPPLDEGDHESEEVYTNQAEFLMAIHPEFIELVDPMESGLVDEMRSHKVFSSGEEQEIRAEVTRRNKARTCWDLLHRVPSNQFQKHCYPAMKARCWLALQGKKFSWYSQGDTAEPCFRHLIQKRLTLRRFADAFPVTKACTLDEYRKITEGSNQDDDLWDLVFQLCARNKDNADFKEMMATTFIKVIKVPIPDNFNYLLAKGFPCKCFHHLSVRTARNKIPRIQQIKQFQATKRHAEVGTHNFQTGDTFPQLKVGGPWPAKKIRCAMESSCGYPSSAVTTNKDEACSLSIISHESKEVVEAEEEEEDSRFQTNEQKECLFRQVEKIEEGIKKAGNIKLLFRQVTGIEYKLSILKQDTKSEPLGDSEWRNIGQIHQLKTMVRDIKRMLKNDFEEASALKEQVEEMGVATGLPFKYKKNLLTRRQVLDNELKEATAFHNQSLEVCRRLLISSHVFISSMKSDIGRTLNQILDELMNQLEFGEDGSRLLPVWEKYLEF